MDGFQAEREQGITIDVAYRFFATDQHKFVVVETPGHEQFTRNMATGASTAQLAVIPVDARKGVLKQTMRHSCIVAMMGIRHVVLAIDKMDLVVFEHEAFNRIEAEYCVFAAELGFKSIQAIQLSALEGDNVFTRGANTPWYRGPMLISYLNQIDVGETEQAWPFRMPVQWVNRPHADFRGFCGRVAQGAVRAGDQIRVLPSGVQTRVELIVVWQGECDHAAASDSIT